MYPQDCLTVVSVPALAKTLCGISRPSHFAGVATVVTKLFNICQPDYAIFGEKDFQQLAVIRQMVTDLNIPVQIHSLPIIREEDGLAMSSRNSYLSSGERQQAVCLFKGLKLGRELAENSTDCKKIINRIKSLILDEDDAVIDYITIINQHTLHDSEHVDENSVLAMAVKIGETRLIDNGFLLNWR
jgi:pantoate--beta-alanine ligase